MSSSPLLSIAVPVYNRETLIGRCLRSILSQDFRDYEILVYDDGSSDNSVQAVRRFDDPRIKLKVGGVNRGINAAWNTLFDMASADWMIVMGSDDEFLPGSLDTAYRRTRDLPADVVCAKFNVKWDTGLESPQPPYREEILDYAGYIAQMESQTAGEGMTMRRTWLREEFRLVEDRSNEALYILNVAKKYKTATFPEFTRLYHTDAPNQTTKFLSLAEVLQRAPDVARASDAMLEAHGEALAKYAPRICEGMRIGAARQYFVAGQRKAGWNMVANLLSERAIRPQLVAQAMLGTVSPTLLASLYVARRWLRTRGI